MNILFNQEQNTPSKYSPTNTVSMMLSDKCANHDNINESSLNSSHLARINEDTMTSHIMNRKTKTSHIMNRKTTDVTYYESQDH